MPLTWKQIEKGVKIQDFTIVNMPELLKKGDPWADFFKHRQALRFG
jgi:DNA primase